MSKLVPGHGKTWYPKQALKNEIQKELDAIITSILERVAILSLIETNYNLIDINIS